ncbi:MAG TPA: hypothetical protein VHR16_11245 [Candidatus Limnocylindrales bacterium]|nr:hypothetical protein [Candidatus Limnocylindrales bacterium]
MRGIVEDGARLQVRDGHGDPRIPEQAELASARGLLICSDDGPDLNAQPRQRERREHDRATETPAAGIVGHDVARGGADDQHHR